MAQQEIEQRVRRAAEAALAQHRFVSAIDVLLALGWLAPSHVQQWQQGRVESLERAVPTNLSKVTEAIAAASVRHRDTDYDELLMSGVDRDTARHRVSARVDEVLVGWRDGG